MEYNTMLLLLYPAIAGVFITCASIVLIIGGAAVNALRYWMGW